MRMYKAATIAQSTPHGYPLALSGISSLWRGVPPLVEDQDLVELSYR